MSTTQIIPKSLKVTLPQNVFILPFTGNFTDKKKVLLAAKLQKHINLDDNKNVSLNDVIKVIYHMRYGSVENDINVTKNGEKTNLSGHKWACNNMPKSQLIILH